MATSRTLRNRPNVIPLPAPDSPLAASPHLPFASSTSLILLYITSYIHIFCFNIRVWTFKHWLRQVSHDLLAPEAALFATSFAPSSSSNPVTSTLTSCRLAKRHWELLFTPHHIAGRSSILTAFYALDLTSAHFERLLRSTSLLIRTLSSFTASPCLSEGLW